jgi:hypothetical protein
MAHFGISDATTVARQDGFAYVVGEFAGVGQQLAAFDVTDPTNPVLVSTTKTGGAEIAHDLLVDGHYAYVLGCDNDAGAIGLTIIEIKGSPRCPELD